MLLFPQEEFKDLESNTFPQYIQTLEKKILYLLKIIQFYGSQIENYGY